ncbi:9672_t:CDS:2, partial [Cetraspora pellucida]
ETAILAASNFINNATNTAANTAMNTAKDITAKTLDLLSDLLNSLNNFKPTISTANISGFFLIFKQNNDIQSFLLTITSHDLNSLTQPINFQTVNEHAQKFDMSPILNVFNDAYNQLSDAYNQFFDVQKKLSD